MKKVLMAAVTGCLLLVYCPLAVSAAAASVEYRFPQTMKLGYVLDFDTEYMQYHHMDPDKAYHCDSDSLAQFSAHFTNLHKGYGDDPDEEGRNWGTAQYVCAVAPGTVTIQAHTYDYDENGLICNQTPLGEPFVMTIEEPVITTTCPATVEVGRTLSVDTALTNTLFQNHTVAAFRSIVTTDNNPYSELLQTCVFYQPSIEILEGKELVERSQADYTHTLTSSETWRFKRSGTVRFKVRYQALVPRFGTQPDTECFGQPYNPETIVTVKIVEKAAVPATQTPPPATKTLTPTTGQAIPPRTAPLGKGDSTGARPRATRRIPTVSAAGSGTKRGDAAVSTATAAAAQTASGSGGLASPAVRVQLLTSGDTYDQVEQRLAGKSRQFALYDLRVEEEEGTGHAGTWPAAVPKPAGAGEGIDVYRVETDGRLVLLDSRVAGDEVRFAISADGIYAVAERAAAADGLPAWGLAVIVAAAAVVVAATVVVVWWRYRRRRAAGSDGE